MPPTNSQPTGMSEFTAAGGGIEYAVDASNVQGVTAGAHSQRQTGRKRTSNSDLIEE